MRVAVVVTSIVLLDIEDALIPNDVLEPLEYIKDGISGDLVGFLLDTQGKVEKETPGIVMDNQVVVQKIQ